MSKKTRSPQKVMKNLLNLREEYARSIIQADWGAKQFVNKLDQCLYGDYDIIRNTDEEKQ